MMDITKSREEFEVNYVKKLRSNFDRNIYRTYRYVSLNVQAHWETWQAARASIVIDLPPKISELNRMLDSGAILLEAVSYDEAIDDCANALRAAGIQIKGESE
ncbi:MULTISPECIES: hypothetical protein [Yersinia]|uniref:hypothetical protein n=1 Tax=Yersinia TaxID=629 RepID=UPI000EB0E9AA|nr:hypothetical protein [Yersinia sp. IP36721]